MKKIVRVLFLSIGLGSLSACFSLSSQQTISGSSEGSSEQNQQQESEESESGVNGAGYEGVLQDIRYDGKVTGWVHKVGEPGRFVNVLFYVDGPYNGGGTFVGSTIANLFRPGSGYSDSFRFYIPEAYRDGTIRTLYIYTDSAAENRILQGSPKEFDAYVPVQAGIDYFEDTVKDLLTDRCGDCHTIGYIQQYDSLVKAPSPANGGSPTSNYLINKARGQEGHGGGNRCSGGVNSSPCLEIQQWWSLEFQ